MYKNLLFFCTSNLKLCKVRDILLSHQIICTKYSVMCIIFMFNGTKKSRKYKTSDSFPQYYRFYLIFHQLAITYTLRLFVAQALHLVFFVFRV